MEDMEDLKRQVNMLAIFCKYLLFEKQQESQISMAFSIMVQERHNNLHTLGNHKEGDGTLFSDCDNEICKMAYHVIKDRNSTTSEMNELTAALTDDYALKIEGITGNVMRAWLEPKSKIIKPEDANLQKTT
jgi:hypothetical protein